MKLSWPKHLCFEVLLAILVFAVFDVTYRQLNSFATDFIEKSSPGMPINLWQSFMRESPIGVYAGADLGLGILMGLFARRRKWDQASVWVCELTFRLTIAAIYWYFISAELSAIYAR